MRPKLSVGWRHGINPYRTRMADPKIESDYQYSEQRLKEWEDFSGKIAKDVEHSNDSMDKEIFMEIFQLTLAFNDSLEADHQLPQELLIAAFSEGSLEGLDPYTAVYWPSQAQELEKMINNHFAGIGINFTKRIFIF